MTLRQQTGPGSRFAAGAGSSLVGTEVPVNLGTARKRGLVAKARVVDDGKAMELTVHVPDDEDTVRFERMLAPQIDPFSIGTR